MQQPISTSSSNVKIKMTPLKEFFDKCYILNCSQKYKQFLKELGVKKNVRVIAAGLRPRVTLTKVDEEYHLKTSYPYVKDVTVKFRVGEAVQKLRPGRVAALSQFYIFDNKLTEKQEVDDKKVLIERTFTKTNLTITMTVNDVKCSRFYTLSSSKHSLGTETSRRSSMLKLSTIQTPESAFEIEKVLENITQGIESEEDVCF